jgi:putative salt-induced outer membrane protein YdiY
MCARAVLLLLSFWFCLRAQTPAAPEPDVLIFTNGERLVGHLLRAHGGTVTFKSDSVGEVNVDWSKIQELHSSQPFAVLDKGVKLGRHSDLSKVPQGRITVANQKLTVAPASGPPQTIPVSETAHVIDQPSFVKDVTQNPGFFEGWNGALAAGASLVEATQQSRTFTGALHFVRAIPTENWLDARNRTLFDFTASYGEVTQPNTPTVKTNIIHVDVERDEYFPGTRAFGFGQAIFDHNFSQGLDLQQTYAGGIGWTAVKHTNTSLDFKAGVSYTRQQFTISANNHNLIGSVFGESYAHKFGKGIQFLQEITVIPAWNEMHAYAANGGASLNVPVYKRLGFSVGLLDSFLNNPPPGFKKNSFQFTTSLTYSLK